MAGSGAFTDQPAFFFMMVAESLSSGGGVVGLDSVAVLADTATGCLRASQKWMLARAETCFCWKKATEGGDVWDGVSAEWKVRSLPVTGGEGGGEGHLCSRSQRSRSQSILSKTLAGRPGSCDLSL